MNIFSLGSGPCGISSTTCKEVEDFLFKAKRIGEKEAAILICTPKSLNDKVIEFLNSHIMWRVFVWGMDIDDAVGWEKLGNRLLVVPADRVSSSLRYLWRKVEQGEVGTKGILRFVSRDNLQAFQEHADFFSSFLFECQIHFGNFKCVYARTFQLERFYRFTALLKTHQGSIIFYEANFSPHVISSQCWEYGFRGGLIVSDDFHQSPLLVASNGNVKGFEHGLFGNQDDAINNLEGNSVPFAEILKSGFLEAYNEMKGKEN